MLFSPTRNEAPVPCEQLDTDVVGQAVTYSTRQTELH